MDGFGPITNTRTLDDAIREMIARLSLVEGTPRARKLLADGRRYQRLMATWVNDPPTPEQQFEIIGHVLQLLGTAMRFVEHHGKRNRETPVPSSSPPVGPRRARKDSTPDIEIGGDEVELETDEPFVAEPAIHRVVEIGSDADVDPRDFAGGVRVVRPHLDAWRAVPRLTGVRTRLVFEQTDGTCHVLVRLDPGAELASHAHESNETVQVIDGCLALGDEELSAGAYVCFQRGAVSPALRSIGETTLLLIATDRRFLR